METPEVIAAQNSFQQAQLEAEMVKQGKIAEAMRLKMPDHLAAIRAAEREYHLALARAADLTDGIIDAAPYRAAAA